MKPLHKIAQKMDHPLMGVLYVHRSKIKRIFRQLNEDACQIDGGYICHSVKAHYILWEMEEKPIFDTMKGHKVIYEKST